MKPAETGPIKAALGWIEHGAKRDAVEFARGYAIKHFDAPNICWYSVLPLLGGWLWEVQEGGPGRTHLPAVAKALASGADQSWFRVGNRAYSVSMRDGRPFCVLLPTEESKVVFASDKPVLTPKGPMTLVVQRGTGYLVLGSGMFVTGAVFLAAVGSFYALSQQYVPPERTLSVQSLAHRAWSRVEAIPPNLYVESLRLEEGTDNWDIQIRPLKPAPPPSDAASPAPAAADANQTDPGPRAEVVSVDAPPTPIAEPPVLPAPVANEAAPPADTSAMPKLNLPAPIGAPVAGE